jgi:phospholipase/lecithinase/hemolysin
MLVPLSWFRMIHLLNSRLFRAALLLCGSVLTLASHCTPAKLHPYDRLYVFGDSYSDVGEGYLDGNGPTAVAYLAERLGFPLMRANDPSAAGKSLDFAISGAKTGSRSGVTIERALLGVGMRNQVDDVTMSRWGPFYDEVILHPARYGIENTTLQCAGRSIRHEDTTPCSNPAAYFYYHHNHPSTAVHKIVGDKLYDEVMA